MKISRSLTARYARALYEMLKGAPDDESFSKTVLLFIKFLRRKRLLTQLSNIAHQMERIERSQRAVVTSAAPLSGDATAAFRAALGKHAEYAVEPELLGGAHIEWQDWRIDASVRGRRQRLKTAL